MVAARLFDKPEGWSDSNVGYLDSHMADLNREDAVIFHVGANAGQEIEKFCQFFNSGKIYCFEANPSCVPLLEKTIEKNRVIWESSDRNFEVAVINAAICRGNTDTVNLYRNIEKHGDAHQSATIMPKDRDYSIKLDQRNHHHKESVSVKAVSIDQFSKNNDIGHIDLLWADIEGAQGEMLLGAKNKLPEIDYIFIEWTPLWGGWNLFEIEDFLKEDFIKIAKIDQDAVFKNRRLPQS